jgi:hypothetical protein
MLVSCGTVRIKNQEWCGDMGPLGASCFNTLNDKTRDIEKEAWDEERFGMVCGKAAVFADTKRTILQLCETSKKCVYDEPKNVVYFYNMNKDGKREKTVTIVKFFNQIEDFTLEVKKLKN